jgi:transcription initiation factor TFIIE subunit alpha
MVKLRLTDKKIDEVVRTLCGDDVLPVVKKLIGKENVSEFKLSELVKEDIRRVRNMLYRLHGQNLVRFTRKKDKKKGWYIYYWTFKPEQVRFLYNQLKCRRRDYLRERLSREEGEQFFVCQNNCVRMDFEQAVNFEYHCPECGSLLSIEEKGNRIETMQKELLKLEKECKVMPNAASV